ncbi:MAG: hypothetical protein Q7S93_11390 [Phenylobacterium sp.]|uniref:hypothetical protein n=1 Tax=Phenylobacterium sp. TaxID=1871053 RepID=UPI00272682AE|nr:hypothetical protein [Phenylobacterium sp.]MDO8410649.1 hypothetical protein [Phenylobacterium sp.]
MAITGGVVTMLAGLMMVAKLGPPTMGMDAATIAIAQIAVAQAAISATGLLGIGFTVYYARQTWAEAKRSADAAAASVEDARQQAASQAQHFSMQHKLAEASLRAMRDSVVVADRAWLSVEFDLSGDLTFSERDIRLPIVCKVKNVGRSPAIRVLWTYKMFANPGEAAQYARANSSDTHLMNVIQLGRVLFPGEEDESNVCCELDRSIFNDQLTRCKEDGVFLSVVVGVEYALPGDTVKRFNYMFEGLARSCGAEVTGFDGRATKVEQSQLLLNSFPYERTVT